MIPVTIRNIVKTFGRVRALDDVSLEIAKGELFFLLGPSGCGKTTLLRSVAGFYVPDRGSVLFGDRDVTRLPAQKRNTAMVFQNYALWPHMTVEANVAFGLAVRKVPRRERSKRAHEALEMVHMGEYGRRKPNQLSGGQQQRVALARALVVKPQCLLLDEPLSNLDAKLRLEMRGEIRRLCKDFGLTGIYVTHDQKEALSIADRMAVMFDGKIGQVGTPSELYRNPIDAAVAEFLGETNFLDATILSRQGEWQVVRTDLGELRAKPADGVAGDRTCTVSIRPEAIEITTAASAEETVEAQGLNRFRGKVVESVYLGEAVQLTLHCGAVKLRASVRQRAADEPLHCGAEVAGTIDPRDVVLLSS